MFQTMNSVVSNNLSVKYQRITPLGCKDISGFENLSLWQRLNYVILDGMTLQTHSISSFHFTPNSEKSKLVWLHIRMS